jgi:hypothetical protein
LPSVGLTAALFGAIYSALTNFYGFLPFAFSSLPKLVYAENGKMVGCGHMLYVLLLKIVSL